MTIQDYPVTFEELEPHFDHFEKVCGTSCVAGNLRGEIRPDGNPFEGARSDEFPNTAIAADLRCRAFRKGHGAALTLARGDVPVMLALRLFLPEGWASNRHSIDTG
jgi:hypothetical protein